MEVIIHRLNPFTVTMEQQIKLVDEMIKENPDATCRGMHHKFLVFCKITKRGSDIINYKPVAVWTGSFNLTHNATMSFENNLYLVDQTGGNYILNGYLNEHHQIFALSEQLNWSSEWVEPEFRIST